jgi:hypothetical protein
MPSIAREAESEISTVHVVPGRTGRWSVHAAHAAPAYVHENATQAQTAAWRMATSHGAQQILVHDRYCRVHVTRVRAPAEGRSRTPTE